MSTITERVVAEMNPATAVRTPSEWIIAILQEN